MADLDGSNKLKFYYIDILQSAVQIIQDPLYVDKLYHTFELKVDREGNRVIGPANSGLVFESLQLLDPTSSPVALIVASDTSHQGNVKLHPLYCKPIRNILSNISLAMLMIINAYYCILIISIPIADTLFNLHESERSKITAWIPFAWMPVYEDTLAPDRLSQGFHGHPARRQRLEHQALCYVFQNWEDRTRDAVQLAWGGSFCDNQDFSWLLWW